MVIFAKVLRGGFIWELSLVTNILACDGTAKVSGAEMKIYERSLQAHPFFPAPSTRVSFRVLLSRDFSRFPQIMESLLASLRSYPLPIIPLCLSREEGSYFSFLSPRPPPPPQKTKQNKTKNAWSQVTCSQATNMGLDLISSKWF